MLQRVTVSASGEECVNTDELHRLNVGVGPTRNITWENLMGTVQGKSPSPRFQLGLASVGDNLYVFGGCDGGEQGLLLAFYSSSKDICSSMNENIQSAMYCESIILVASILSPSLASKVSCTLI